MSTLEVPDINWAKYAGCKSIQYIKIGHAPKINAEESGDYDQAQTARDVEKKFSTDLKLLVAETTNDER